MIMKNNKKGAAHIEIIISFVIFIGFLMFLFATLNPIKEIRIDESIFESVKYNIENHLDLKTKISYVSIKLEETPSDCFIINNIAELENCDVGLIVKNADGIEVGSSFTGQFNIKNSGDFYTIYCSKEISNTLPCSDGTPVNYKLGIIKKEDAVSISKLKTEIFDKYKNKDDYETMKQTLGIPARNDFGLRFKDGKDNVVYDGTEFEALKKIPATTKVSSKSYSVKILYPDANIKNVIMNILIW